jgi:hypothetical protein
MADTTGTGNIAWYDESDTETSTLFSVVRRLENRAAPRRRILQICADVYECVDFNQDALSLLGGGAKPNAVPIIRSLVDTLYNRFAKSKPVPELLPVKGNWDARNKAKVATQWLKGIYAQNGVHSSLMPKFVHNGLMTGTGAIQVHDEGSAGIQYDLVNISRLLVHPREELNNKVVTFYKSIGIDRSVLKAKFGTSGIDTAEQYPYSITESGKEIEIDDICDDKHLIEAWHLPLEKDDNGEWKGGRHTIALSHKVLHTEEWKIPEFPFVFWSFRPRVNKFFGMGVAESVLAAHMATNDVANIIDDAVEAMTPKVCVQDGSMPTAGMTNGVGKVWKINGQMPQAFTPPPVHPAVLEREGMMISRAYQFEGVSEQDAMMVRPAGIDSGIGQQVYHDIGSTRYAVPSQDLDHAIAVDLARHTLRLAEENVVKGKTKTLQTLGVGQDGFTAESISYEEARVDHGKYILQASPVSSLPDTPTGKLEYVDKLRQMNLITDPAKLRRLLSMPDINADTEMEFAGFELVDKIIAAHLALKPWEDIPTFSPYMPQAYALDCLVKQRDLAQLEGAPAEVLSRLASLIGFVQSQPNTGTLATAPAMPPMPAQPMPIEGMPQVPPAPPIM